MRGFKEVTDKLEAQMNKKMMEEVITTSVAHAPIELSMEVIEESYKKVQRLDFLYVVACDFIPEDAYGIIYLRPEDARRVKEKSQELLK